MKKRLIVIFLTLAVLAGILAACSQTSSTASSTSLSEAENLMVGIIKMDGTAQSISSEQANTLLPLWQAYQSLASSSTSSQTEKDALVKQINSTLTSEQLKAINALKLTTSDMQSLFSNSGFNPAYETTQTVATPSAALQSAASGSSSGSVPAGGPGGAPPSGGGPGGDITGGGPMDTGAIPSTNGTPNPSANSTPQAGQTGNASNPMIYNLIIRYLETKISGK